MKYIFIVLFFMTSIAFGSIDMHENLLTKITSEIESSKSQTDSFDDFEDDFKCASTLTSIYYNFPIIPKIDALSYNYLLNLQPLKPPKKHSLFNITFIKKTL